MKVSGQHFYFFAPHFFAFYPYADQSALFLNTWVGQPAFSPCLIQVERRVVRCAANPVLGSATRAALGRRR
jgi:hypothetical protein